MPAPLSGLLPRFGAPLLARRLGVSVGFIRAVNLRQVAFPTSLRNAARRFTRQAKIQRLTAVGSSFREARKFRDRSFDSIKDAADRLDILVRDIAERRRTTVAVIRKSMRISTKPQEDWFLS